MRGNSQNGGQTTKSLLIKPQCSGVPNTAGSVAFLLLSTTLPAFCLYIYIDKTKIPEHLQMLRYFRFVDINIQTKSRQCRGKEEESDTTCCIRNP